MVAPRAAIGGLLPLTPAPIFPTRPVTSPPGVSLFSDPSGAVAGAVIGIARFVLFTLAPQLSDNESRGGKL
jgi:hypothetical protein